MVKNSYRHARVDVLLQRIIIQEVFLVNIDVDTTWPESIDTRVMEIHSHACFSNKVD